MLEQNEKINKMSSNVQSKPSGGSDEQRIRKIVQEEIIKNSKSGNPIIPPHRHNGNDNLRISQKDIIPLLTANGSINMGHTAVYQLKLGNYGITPTAVTFYGGAFLSTGNGKHAMVVGNAQLGINQQFQPESSTSVIVGPVRTTIIQGSACIIIDDSDVNKTVIRNSEGHIVYVQDQANTIVALATVASYDNSVINISVELVANWSISGLWTIT